CDLLRENAPIEPVPPGNLTVSDGCYHEDGARIAGSLPSLHPPCRQQAEDRCKILVCHTNVFHYFVCRSALQFPPEGWRRLGLNNGSITWITIRPSGRVGLRMGDSGFMPPEKLTRT
uniref:Uncharacterized protein n=1 Tax=Oncorhynchus tshawytscha TaxID=74940 RepID=A0A8C8GVM0_ONCTS